MTVEFGLERSCGAHWPVFMLHGEHRPFGSSYTAAAGGDNGLQTKAMPPWGAVLVGLAATHAMRGWKSCFDS